VIANLSGGYADHENPVRMLAQLVGSRRTTFVDAGSTAQFRESVLIFGSSP
jgi:hypothetical protein